MIAVKKASKRDLPAIRELTRKYKDVFTVDDALLNSRDIALQARAEDGTLVGFIWCGLMAQGTVGYIDKFVIDPGLTRKQVGRALTEQLGIELTKRHVKNVFAFIRQDEFHERCAMNALKNAMAAYQEHYTYIYADVNKAFAARGEVNGR